MNNLLLIAFISLSWLSSDPVPAAVQSRFDAMFPKAEEVQWKEAKKGMVAVFKHYSSRKQAFFTPQGDWMETRIQRPLWRCPDPVIAYLKLNHETAVVTMAAKVVDKEGVSYRLEAEYPGKVVILRLNEGGYLLREEIIPFAFELDF